MKIFIQEFVSGGGLSNQDLNANILVEGFGMLRVLTQNCKRLGCEVISTLDERLEFLSHFLEIDHLIKISPNESFIEEGKKLLQNTDYFLVIAPETDGLLSNVVNKYSSSPSHSLNCKTRTIDFAADKSRVYEFCSKTGFNFPKTIKITKDGSCWLLMKNQIKKKVEGIDQFQEWELKYPLIIKPNDGVACDGLKLCRTQKELLSALQENKMREILIQEFIYGDNLSITTYVWKGQMNILAINEQIVSIGVDKSEYLGGISNVNHSLSKEIITLCLELLSKLDGLQGFIGIDIIISKSDKNNREIFLIEINPRAITPICGLMNQNNKPINLTPNINENHFVKHFNVAYFAKAKFSFHTQINHQLYLNNLYDIGIITPPLCFDNKNVFTLLRGIGKNKEIAIANFNKKLSAFHIR